MSNEVYYRILVYKEQLTVACMTYVDEFDYDESKFFIDKEGNVLKFETENAAINWLNKNIKESRIDPKYLRLNYEDWYK